MSNMSEKQAGKQPQQPGDDRSSQQPLAIPPPTCPRCFSTNTKFCYFNNYSVLQPRYLCKTCGRYWTLGGSVRSGNNRKRARDDGASTSSSSPHQQFLPPPPPPPPRFSPPPSTTLRAGYPASGPYPAGGGISPGLVDRALMSVITTTLRMSGGSGGYFNIHGGVNQVSAHGGNGRVAAAIAGRVWRPPQQPLKPLLVPHLAPNGNLGRPPVQPLQQRRPPVQPLHPRPPFPVQPVPLHRYINQNLVLNAAADVLNIDEWQLGDMDMDMEGNVPEKSYSPPPPQG